MKIFPNSWLTKNETTRRELLRNPTLPDFSHFVHRVVAPL